MNGPHFKNVNEVVYPDRRVGYVRVKTYPSGMIVALMANGSEIIVKTTVGMTFQRVGDIFVLPTR